MLLLSERSDVYIANDVVMTAIWVPSDIVPDGLDWTGPDRVRSPCKYMDDFYMDSQRTDWGEWGGRI